MSPERSPSDCHRGYRLGRGVDAFSGLAGGFYEGLGFTQSLRVRLTPAFDLEASGRIAGVSG